MPSLLVSILPRLQTTAHLSSVGLTMSTLMIVENVKFVGMVKPLYGWCPS